MTWKKKKHTKSSHICFSLNAFSCSKISLHCVRLRSGTTRGKWCRKQVTKTTSKRNAAFWIGQKCISVNSFRVKCNEPQLANEQTKKIERKKWVNTRYELNLRDFSYSQSNHTCAFTVHLMDVSLTNVVQLSVSIATWWRPTRAQSAWSSTKKPALTQDESRTLWLPIWRMILSKVNSFRNPR